MTNKINQGRFKLMKKLIINFGVSLEVVISFTERKNRFRKNNPNYSHSIKLLIKID